MARKPDDSMDNTTLVGWQGYTLTVPAHWTMGAIGGDDTEGYLRLDGIDMPRCELKWFNERGPVTIETVIDKYLNDLQKKRKRRDPDVTVKRDTRLLGRRKGGRLQIESFRWDSEEQQAHGAAWVCKACGRTTIIQILGTPGEDIDELATQVILAVVDHPNEGWTTWATYGLHCEIPDEYKLSGQKLMAGLIELNFTLESEKIAVMRWGMSDVALANESLVTWAQKELSKRQKGWNCTYEEIEFNGHPGIAVTGGSSQVGVNIRTFINHCLRKTYGSNVMSLVWHCEQEKKIYCVETIVDDANKDLPVEVCGRIPCHKG